MKTKITFMTTKGIIEQLKNESVSGAKEEVIGRIRSDGGWFIIGDEDFSFVKMSEIVSIKIEPYKKEKPLLPKF